MYKQNFNKSRFESFVLFFGELTIQKVVNSPKSAFWKNRKIQKYGIKTVWKEEKSSGWVIYRLTYALHWNDVTSNSVCKKMKRESDENLWFLGFVYSIYTNECYGNVFREMCLYWN